MDGKQGKIVAISISEKKGVPKKNIEKGLFKENHGLVDDAHAGDWHRQVSLLAVESINKMLEKGLKVSPGDFAENLTTEGIDLTSLPLGARLKVGETELEVTQIGKKCHSKCAVYYRTGDCIMPREGIFAKVISGGLVKVGDSISII
ncbi:MAG: MOSC domain-containing protein [Dethiobacteria bacterium]|jgi:MOSC domain-containing protein YiiM|nr:MOSC domain-containing protein [Bacillota bacterium]